MSPTLEDGNIVCIQKYNLSIKINDYIYVNGNKNDNLYIQNVGQVYNEITLNEGEYFVLGDNRQNSIDSRFEEVGIIHEEEIIGKIVFRKVEIKCKD